MNAPSLNTIERVAKIIALVGIPLAVTLVPLIVNWGLKERELSLEYSKLAVSILQDPNTVSQDSEMRKWAISVLNEFSPIPFSAILEEQLKRGEVSLPEHVYSSINMIKSGKYIEVSTEHFIPVVEATRQLTKDEIEDFVNDAYELLKSEDKRSGYTRADRWDIDVGDEGSVFIFRTRDRTEFLAALKGVFDTLSAIKERRELQGVTVNIRGTEKFYDIKGLPGVSNRAWIGFDLR